MPLQLIAFNPSKKAARRAKRRARRQARTTRTTKARASRASKQGGHTMAKKAKKKGFFGRRGSKTSTRHSSSPPSNRRKGGGGGGGMNFKSLLGDLLKDAVTGGIVAGATVGTAVGANFVLKKLSPDKAGSALWNSAAQVAVGIAGLIGLRMIGMRQIGTHFYVGSVSGAGLNLYGDWAAKNNKTTAGSAIGAGMRGLSGLPGPNQNPNFVPAGGTYAAMSA